MLEDFFYGGLQKWIEEEGMEVALPRLLTCRRSSGNCLQCIWVHAGDKRPPCRFTVHLMKRQSCSCHHLYTL